MVRKIFATEEDKNHISQLNIDQRASIDDDVDYSKIVVQKPWGEEYLIYRNENLAAWVLQIKKGHKTSIHCHPNKKTALIVLAGRAKYSTLSEAHYLFAGQGVVFEKGVFHTTEAIYPESVMLLEMETPNDKKDLIRLHDKYGRNGIGYEGKEFHIDLTDTRPHFHNSQNLPHEGKRFGQCQLVVIKSDIFQPIKMIQNRFSADAVAVLKGNLCDRQKKTIMATGDVIYFRDMMDKTDVHVDARSELLLIKKI